MTQKILPRNPIRWALQETTPEAWCLTLKNKPHRNSAFLGQCQCAPLYAMKKSAALTIVPRPLDSSKVYALPIMEITHKTPAPEKCHHSRISTSTHGTRHSFFPSMLRIHSTPIPVHSVLTSMCRLTSSIAAPVRAAAVLFIAVARNELSPALLFDIAADSLAALAIGFGSGDDRWRGSNQLLWKSKKQWSDQ